MEFDKDGKAISIDADVAQCPIFAGTDRHRPVAERVGVVGEISGVPAA